MPIVFDPMALTHAEVTDLNARRGGRRLGFVRAHGGAQDLHEVTDRRGPFRRATIVEWDGGRSTAATPRLAICRSMHLAMQFNPCSRSTKKRSNGGRAKRSGKRCSRQSSVPRIPGSGFFRIRLSGAYVSAASRVRVSRATMNAGGEGPT